MSERKKGAMLSYVIMAIEVLSGLFFAPLLIRILGQEEYGVYSLVNSITAYLYLFDLGIGNSIIKYMAKYKIIGDKHKQHALLSMTLVFYVIIGIIIALTGLVIKNNMSGIFGVGLNEQQIGIAKKMLRIAICNVVMTLFFAPFNKTILAFERFAFAKIADICKIVIRVSMSIAALYLGGRGLTIIAINLLMTIVFGAVSAVYVLTVLNIKPHFGKADKSFLKEVVLYSSIIFIQMLATQLNAVADQLIIAMTVKASAAALGIYAIGIQIVNYFQSFATGVNGVLMPGVVRLVEENAKQETFENEMARVGRIIFMILGLIYVVFLVFGKDFIILWAGAENVKAYYVVSVICLPLMFTLTMSVGNQILWAMDKHRQEAYVQIFVVLLNIGLTYYLVKIDVIIGAVTATAIAYFCDIVISSIFYKKYIGISVKSYYQKLCRGIVPCLVLSFFAGKLFSFVGLTGWLGFCVNCVVQASVYAVAIWFVGANLYEKDIIRNFIKRMCG